jgi:hypothetical protein
MLDRPNNGRDKPMIIIPKMKYSFKFNLLIRMDRHHRSFIICCGLNK